MTGLATTPELPRDLAPWRQELDLFPADLVLSLHGPLRRLRGLIGSLSPGGLGGVGDPDGYQDLARRGPYERLVASEWLLAEEVPEEFDRRAAMGEHLFLELAHRSPRTRGRSLALFDSGPDQLGAPRIAQIALLILMAGRARSAGATFQWGLAQRPELGWYSEVTKSTVLSFLGGRCAEPVLDDHVEAWRHRWEKIGEADDLWCIGGHGLTRHAHGLGASAVTVEDPLDPELRTLRIRAERAGARPKSVELDLPVDARCVRLLRDPFSIVVAAAERSSLPSPVGDGLVFAAGGGRLLVRRADGGLSGYHVPGSPAESPGRTRNFRLAPGDELVAGGYLRGFLGATLAGHALTLHGVPWPAVGRKGGKLVVGLPVDFNLAPAPADGRFGFCYLGRSPHGQWRMVVVDRAGRAVELAPSIFEPLVQPGERVIAVDGTLDNLLLIVEEDGRVPGAAPWAVKSWRAGQGSNVVRRDISAAAELAAIFGQGSDVFGIAMDDRTWRVRAANGAGERDLHPGRDARPVAVAWGADGAGLVILEDDRRTFSLVHLRASTIIVRSEAEVTVATGCRARACFGFVTAAGEVAAFDIHSKSFLFRLWPRKGA